MKGDVDRIPALRQELHTLDRQRPREDAIEGIRRTVAGARMTFETEARAGALSWTRTDGRPLDALSRIAMLWAVAHPDFETTLIEATIASSDFSTMSRQEIDRKATALRDRLEAAETELRRMEARARVAEAEAELQAIA